MLFDLQAVRRAAGWICRVAESVRYVGIGRSIGDEPCAFSVFLASTVCLLALSLTATAAVQLPNLFSDHAVLQRDRPVRVWGWGQAGENVTVRFHGQTVAAQADPVGYWEAWLKPEPAGGPYTLTVSSDSTTTPLERKDILVGDVWLASGQSNMEFPLAGFTGRSPHR